MNHSTLFEQVKKKGRIISPWVDQLGDIISLSSWSLERLPEYIWLGLILNSKGRTDGISICFSMLREIIRSFPELSSARISGILDMKEDAQVEIYRIVSKYVDAEILSPLTLVIDEKISMPFFRRFYSPILSVDKRIEALQTVAKKFNTPDSDEATDLRYIAIVPQVLSGTLHFPKDSPLESALLYYGTTPHSDDIMRMYRPTIRSTEGALCMPCENTNPFVDLFWNKMCKLTECGLKAIVYQEGESSMDYSEFIEKTKEALDYLNVENTERTATDDAFSVLSGSFAYALKTFDEVIKHDLANTIIGRQSTRIIMEIYIMMKYLSLCEAEKPLIWSQYKAYGVGKYKLILLKLREGMGAEATHVNETVLDALVNEPQTEEFTDIDLKYFDDVNIREKAIKVDEKDSYDVSYDYDSSFAHGLWGAVRESSMLCCDNVFHHFRPVADASLMQNLPDVTLDCYNYLVKLIRLVNDRYAFPEWYINYLEEHIS